MPDSKAHTGFIASAAAFKELLLRWKVRGNLFLRFWMPKFSLRSIKSQSLGSKLTSVSFWSPCLFPVSTRDTALPSNSQSHWLVPMKAKPKQRRGGRGGGANSPYLSLKTWGGTLVGCLWELRCGAAAGSNPLRWPRALGDCAILFCFRNPEPELPRGASTPVPQMFRCCQDSPLLCVTCKWEVALPPS